MRKLILAAMAAVLMGACSTRPYVTATILRKARTKVFR